MKILIAIPVDRYISAETFKSIYDLECDSYQVDFNYVKSYSIDRARNILVKNSISYYDYLFFVDSDIILPKHSLKSLISHQQLIVSGIYYKKNYSQDTEIYTVDVQGRHHAFNKSNLPNKLFSISAAGLGCCLIDLSVFNRLEFPYFKDTSLDVSVKTLSEDLYFFKKCRYAGIPAYADPNVVCGHLGVQVW